jgi:hypothetical protein
MASMRWRWLLACAALVCVALVALRPVGPPARWWHSAQVVSVESSGLFRYLEIIDSRDPECRLEYREFRNPLWPLSISKGMTVQVAQVQARGGPVVYLVDQRGHQHSGRLILQALMARRAPEPR